MKTPQQYSYVQTFKWIFFRLPKRRQKQFWILFFGMACSGLLETMALGSIAFFASAVTDPVQILSSKYIVWVNQATPVALLNNTKNLLIVSGLLMLILVVFKNIASAVVTYWITRFGVIIEAFFGEVLLDGFLKLPYQWHLSSNSADLVTAISWRHFLGRNSFQPCLNMFHSILTVSIMLVVLFVVQPIVSLLMVIILGGTAYFIYSVIRRLLDKVTTIERNYDLLINKETTMAIHGAKDVKISQREDSFVKKFTQSAVPFARIIGLKGFYTSAPRLILEVVGFGMLYVSICVLLLWFDSSTAFVTGTMVLLSVTAWKVLPAVNLIMTSATSVRTSLPYISTLINYFSLIEAQKSSVLKKATKPVKFDKSIKFEKVSFNYQSDEKEVLQSLSFEIKKGETVGIIGASGAGKSTLVDLLIGLLEPARGTIFIDEKPLTNDSLPSWIKIIGYVSQSPYIYDGTLAENIAFGIETDFINEERVRVCCSMAAMDDFVHDLPQNIETFVGERGVKLSGGQQQRIAIARALYDNPEIMIFDEATSSLDPKSEKSIQRTIYSFKGKRTLFIIAHRLSSVEDCDKVIWVEKGQLRMMGSPERVLEEYKINVKENVLA